MTRNDKTTVDELWTAAARDMTGPNATRRNDLAGSFRMFVTTWGLPIAAMIATIWLEAHAKAPVWIGALGWMGVACLANARRCGRTHCYFTGPFFLFMTVPVALHGFAVIPFGPQGWSWLGLAIGAGGGLLWCVPELIWGRYLKPRERQP